MLQAAAEGPLVMGLRICFLRVLLRLVSLGVLVFLVGIGLACLCLVWLMGLFSIFVLLFWMLGVTKSLWAYVLVRVFEEVPFLMFLAPCSYLTLTMFGREIRRCFGVSLLEVSGMGFFLGRFRVRMCLVGSVGVVIMMVISFEIVVFHL